MSTPAILSEELRQSLTSIGLAICSDSTEGVPSPSQAMQAVNGGEVEPKYTVPYRSDDALGELDRLWHAEANAVSLYANAGKFLLILPGPGSSHAGWLCVQDTVGERLPPELLRLRTLPSSSQCRSTVSNSAPLLERNMTTGLSATNSPSNSKLLTISGA